MLNGKQVYLRTLSLEDVTQDYILWMNDYEIVKYTESRFRPHTRESVEEFVRNSNNATTFTFAIVAKEMDKHIGNIKLGNVNWIHRCGDIGLIIGRKDYHGRGIATESIRIITDFAFRQLGLHKIKCGIYEPNVGSLRAFQKAGFEIYAREPRTYILEGRYIDAIYLHRINVSEIHP